jgi:hypothetical protein
VDRIRTGGLAEVPIRAEGADDRVSVTGFQRVVEAAHDITGTSASGLEDGRPDVAFPEDRPLTDVGAEHDGLAWVRGSAT